MGYCSYGLRSSNGLGTYRDEPVVALLASMSASGVKPDARCCTAAVNALAVEGKWEAAKALIADVS